MNEIDESVGFKMDSVEKIISSTLDICMQDIFCFSPAYPDDYDDL
jgi:hypothetical protein